MREDPHRRQWNSYTEPLNENIFQLASLINSMCGNCLTNKDYNAQYIQLEILKIVSKSLDCPDLVLRFYLMFAISNSHFLIGWMHLVQAVLVCQRSALRWPLLKALFLI